jgi:putative membrane protein
MLNIDDKMRAEIRQAVEDLEKSTSGELVCVVAPSSARYVLFPLLWAALGALLLPVLNPILELMKVQDFAVTFTVQSLFFLGLAALFLFTPLKWKVIPGSVLVGNCHRAACEQFFMQKLHETKKRAGVLLFVSVGERYVELLADKGISDLVDAGEWGGIIDVFAGDIREGRVHDGFLKAINACKAILARHLPEVRNDVNELTDNLVELPEAEFIS